MSVESNIVHDQITKAKVLSENLYDMLEKYSFMDVTETFADANRTMDVLVCARQIHDILEDLYENQTIEKIDSEPNLYAGDELGAMLNTGISLDYILRRKK
jgi:hypothetical protein